MSNSWSNQRERSNRVALIVMVWIARRFGRNVARAVLHLVTFYYLLFAPSARDQSRQYLRRVLKHEPQFRHIYRHLFYFASTFLDRVYMFGKEIDKLDINIHGKHSIHRHRDAQTGAIVIVAHLGSFEILRVTARSEGQLHMRVLIDRVVGAKANRVLAAINLNETSNLIDTSVSDVDRVLKVQAMLEAGEMVSLMADRFRDHERVVYCDFLGAQAAFPMSPWLLAGITKAPVLLAFGLYMGGNRYDLHLEEFSPCLELPRAQRYELVQKYAQQYADRLAYYTRLAPYNWFNFYNFWDTQ